MGSFTQVRDANLNITYTGGKCLAAVQNAFGTPHLFPSAIDDWLSGEHDGDTSLGNHDSQSPPEGVEVPVYLALGDVEAGDVAISLGDGRVAAAALAGTNVGLYIYGSLQDYINDYGKYNGGATYLGWSEGTANTRVVQYVPEVTTQDVTQSDVIAFEEQTVDDPLLAKGQTQTTQVGVNGSHTVVTRVTYTDGTATDSQVVSDVTVPATPHVLAIGSATQDPPASPVDPTPPTPPITPTKTWLQRFIEAIVAVLNKLFKGDK